MEIQQLQQTNIEIQKLQQTNIKLQQRNMEIQQKTEELQKYFSVNDETNTRVATHKRKR